MQEICNWKNYHRFIMLVAVISLALAYIAEYIFHLTPCPLCVYQRFPFMMMIIVSIVGLVDINFQGKKFYIMIFLLGVLLSAYHTLVENGIVEMSALCKPAVQIADNISVKDFKAMLQSVSASACNKPAFVFLWLSMTEWNLILNILLLTMTIMLNSKTKGDS